MKILWVATKAPWPPRDGGRLLLWNTLRALAAAGHRIDLVAPIWEGSRESAEAEGQLAAWCTPHLVRARPRSAAATFLRSWISGEPWTLERHRLPAVGRAVTSLVRDQPRDVVVAEQLQALAQTDRLGRSGRLGSAVRARVLRAQNVESDLWAASAAAASDLRSAWLRAQARRLRRAEGAAVRSVDAVVALTARDAVALTALSGSTSVGAIPAPFETTLPAAEGALPGRPPLVLLGSPGWEPNEVQTRHFVRDIWPEVSSRVPEARLHIFGRDRRRGRSGGRSAKDRRPPRAARQPRRVCPGLDSGRASGGRVGRADEDSRGLGARRRGDREPGRCGWARVGAAKPRSRSPRHLRSGPQRSPSWRNSPTCTRLARRPVAKCSPAGTPRRRWRAAGPSLFNKLLDVPR